MRQIKFRGKRLDNGELVYGYYYSFKGQHFIQVEWDKMEDDYSVSNSAGAPGVKYVKTLASIPVDPSNIGQFTGLLDKNGKEIYEGDIIDCNMFFENGTLPHRGEIVWMSKYGTFGTKNQAGETMLHNHDYSSMQVIGNIHSNPELLNNL